MVELGRVDIYYEVSVLSQYLAAPRVGHLETVYHIFAYLQKQDKSSIIFDPTEPYHDPAYFIDQDWKEFYGNVEEELPPRMPEPLGRPVTISTFVDAHHAGNVVARRLHTGILIYLQILLLFGRVDDRTQLKLRHLAVSSSLYVQLMI
jgi:hypothetical protein